MNKIFFLLFLPVLLFSSLNKPQFTQEELQYIQNNPTIKVGSGDDWAPFNFIDGDGEFQGITKDYLDLLNQKSGLKIELTTGKWKDVLQLFKDKKLDLLPAALYAKEREEFGNYVKPHIKLRDFIYARENDSSINSFEDLNGKTLVRIKGYAVLDPYLPHLKNVKIIEVDSTLELVSAVHNKKADAFLEGQANINHVLKENMISGFKSIAQTVSTPTTAHMLVKKDSPILYSIISKVFTNITKDEHDIIYNKWISIGIEKKSLIKLTPEQKEWISNHPSIIVGGEMDWGPFDFVDENGEYRGLANDYLKLISEKTGLKFDVKTGMTWGELIEAIDNKTIDLLPAIYYTKEREQNLVEYTNSYLSLSQYFYTLKTNPSIRSIDQLYGKKVSVIKGYAINSWLKKKHPKIILITKDSVIEALNAVVDKEVYAYIGDNPSTTFNIQKHFINGLKIDSTLDEFNPTKVYMGVRKDYAILSSIISDAIASVSHSERTKIEKKWMTSLNQNSKRIKLTKKEREWLKMHPSIRMVADPSWEPFEFIDKETAKLSGMSKSYLDIITQKTGMKFELTPIKDWTDGVQKMKDRESDFFSCVNETPSRKEYMNFSAPYLNFAVVIVTQSDKPLMNNVSSLYSKKVVFIKGYPITEIVLNDHLQIIPLYVDNIAQALQIVSDGEAYAFISMQEVASYNINKERLFNLKIAGKTDYTYPLHFALRNDWDSTGIDIINKALSSITDKERNEIYNKWVSITYEKQVNYKLLFQISAMFIFFIFVSLYWNHRLSIAKKLIEEKTNELDEQKQFVDGVMNSQRDIVITTDGKIIHSVNKAFLDFFHIDSLEDFTDEYNCVCDRFVIDDSGEFIQKTMGGMPWTNYVYQHPKKLNKAKILQDEKEHIFSISITILNDSMEALITVVLNDITELELQKKQLELILDNLPDPMIITQDAKIVFANPEALKSFQVQSLNDILGHDSTRVYKDKKDRLEILRTLKTEDFIHNKELQLISPDKRIVDALTSIMKIKYNGEPSLLATYTDITEQKVREREINRLHKHVTDSIEYASLIQHAIIPDNTIFSKYFKDYFTIWEPKDTIGGDIYLLHDYSEDELILMVIDCTGHGVPGAFITMLVKAIERQIVANIYKDIVISPAKILKIFNKSLKHLLKQEDKDAGSNAGFDGAILCYDKKERVVKFSGANISLFYVEETEVKTIKGDRQSIGYRDSDASHEFKEHIIKVKDDMNFYLTTDGYIDQNGGEKGFPLGKKRFADIVKKHYNKSCIQQKDMFLEDLLAYQGDEDRNDDITMVGFKI